MPRLARKKSATGIYHVILKGIDDRDIFLDDYDRSKFIEQIFKSKNKSKFDLIAYCLMDNHAHLLIQESDEIGKIIKQITVGYVIWHNNKYARIGHLFQNRFLSEVVEDDNYLLAVVRYIHQNPVKAGIVKSPVDYEWSSFRQYLAAYNGRNYDIFWEKIKGYFRTKIDFEKFMNIAAEESCLDFKEKTKYTDESLRNIINQDFNIKLLNELPVNDRNQIIRQIRVKTGASVRQLGRVLGLGKGIIQRGLDKASL